VVSICAKIFGLTFTLVPNAPVWYKDVYADDVTDTATGAYLDRSAPTRRPSRSTPARTSPGIR
jgi:hypothetical protein